MTSSPLARRGLGGALLALALLGVVLGERERRSVYTTSDEPEHVRAARELRYGPGVVSNFEHPVVMKVLAGAFLRPERPVRFVDETRDARRAFPFLYGALVAVAAGWAAWRSGKVAGLSVGAILLAEPTVRVHSTLVQSDLLLTLFLTAAAAAVDAASSALGSSRRRWLLAAGGAYGLGLASKYSALPFLPVFAAVAAVALWPRRTAPPGPGKKRGRAGGPPSARPPAALAAVLSRVLVPAAVVAAAIQQGALLTTPVEALKAGVVRKFESLAEGRAALAAASSLPRGAAAYAAGLLWVKASATPGARYNYFLGEVSGNGFLLYFPVALAVKLTAATVVLLLGALAAAALALARGPSARRGRRARLLFRRCSVPVSLGLAYLALAMLSDVNIGVRHVLPSVPLLLVGAAGALRTALAGRRRLLAALLVVAALLSTAEAVATRGREIPFGNVFVGGPPGVRRLLSDSNVEWGEAQERLFERASRGDLGRVGLVVLALDLEEAARRGLPQVDDLSARPVDTAIVSVHVHDLALALARNTEDYANVAWLRGWLVPLVAEIRERATSVEPLGDEYLVFRLRPGG